MSRKKRIFLAVVYGFHYFACGEGRRRLNNVKKKRIFLAVVYGFHYLCRLL